MSDPNDAGRRAAETYRIAFSIEGDTAVLMEEGGEGDTIEVVVARLAAMHSRPELCELLVSLEDEDEPAAASVEVREFLHANRRGRAHLHRCHRIRVTVEYNSKPIADDFPPAATVHRLLKWVVGRKGLDIQDDVHDLALQVVGSTKALEPNIHIGTLIRPGTCTLALELVSKDRPQG